MATFRSCTGGFTRRGLLATGAVAAPFVRRASAEDNVLYVNTWGGPWEQSAKAHLFEPFTRATGIEIRTVSPVSFAKLAAQVRTGVYEFDVTTLGVAELARANQAKLIETAEGSGLDQSKLWPNAVMLNGVASHAFANCISYRTDHFPKGGPQDWAEFWDVERFPGSRSLQRYAARVIAFALMADGVRKDALFPYDLDRAFRSLDRIKPHVRVWWNQGPQSGQLLRDGEVDAIGIWSTQVKQLIDQHQPVELVWNQALLDVALWVVAKGTPRAKNAWRFIAFAVQAEGLAQFAKQNGYGPMNPKAFDYLAEADARTMPTWPANFEKAIVLDATKIGPQIDEMTKRFDQWIAS